MPRLIRHEAMGPIKIDPSSFPRDAQGNLKPIFICACGLSKTMPTCDGMHKSCATREQPGKLYVYGDDRATVIEEREDR